MSRINGYSTKCFVNGIEVPVSELKIEYKTGIEGCCWSMIKDESFPLVERHIRDECIDAIGSISRESDWNDHNIAKIERYINHLIDQVNVTTESCINTLTGRCKREDKHGYMSLGEFIDQGGGSCPLCLTEKVKEFEAKERSVWYVYPEPVTREDTERKKEISDLCEKVGFSDDETSAIQSEIELHYLKRN